MPYIIAAAALVTLYILWRWLERTFPRLFGPGDLTEQEAALLDRWRNRHTVPQSPVIPSEGPWIIENPNAGEPDR